MVKFFIIMLLIIPWCFLPFGNIEDQFRLPQACMMDIMFLGLITMSFYKGNNLVYKNKYLSYLIGYIFLNFVFFFFIPFSLNYKTHGRALNICAMEPMIHIFLGLWAVQIILTNFEREDFFRIAKALCLSSSLISVFAILQRIGFDPMRAVGAKYFCGNQISACLDNPNLVGMYLVLCLPLFLIFKEIKYKLGFLLTIIGLLITKCHFAIGLAGISLGLYTIIVFRKNRWVLSGIALAILISLLLILKYKFGLFKLYNGMSGRLDIWKIALEKIKVSPLFGQGIGVWKTFNITTTGNNNNITYWYYAHSDWLERTIEIGIIGIGLLWLVIVNSLKNFSYEKENVPFLCMFVTFLVMMTASFPWEVSTIATLGVISFTAVEKL